MEHRLCPAKMGHRGNFRMKLLSVFSYVDPMPRQSWATRLLLFRLAGSEFASAQSGILGVCQPVGNQNSICRIEGEQAKVEQRVEIGAKQKSIAYVVGLGASIRVNVRGLQKRFDVAFGDCAAPVICGQQIVETSPAPAVSRPSPAFSGVRPRCCSGQKTKHPQRTMCLRGRPRTCSASLPHGKSRCSGPRSGIHHAGTHRHASGRIEGVRPHRLRG